MKPTEILLDLNDLKLGRIVKKDFEEVIADISAIAPLKAYETLPRKAAETLPTAPKTYETKWAETAPKAFETRKAAESK